MLNSVVMFICQVLNWKILLAQIWSKKVKVACLRWSLVNRLILICWIRWWCLNFLFWTGYTPFEQISSKMANCPTKMKLGVYTNLKTLNSVVMLICPVLDGKYTFLANLFRKMKIAYLLSRCVIFAKWNGWRKS